MLDISGSPNNKEHDRRSFSRFVSLSSLTEGRGVTSCCAWSYPAARGPAWQGWCDGSFKRNPILRVGELFLSPVSLLNQHHPGEPCSSCSRDRGARDGSWSPPLLCQSPWPSQWEAKAWFWVTWGKRAPTPLVLQERACEEMFGSLGFTGPSSL